MTSKKISIEYNHNLPLGVVSPDPYNFLILDKFFDDFKFVSSDKQTWLQDLSLKVAPSSLGQKSTYGEAKELYRSKKFVDMVKADPKRKYVMYSPLDPPYKVNPLTYLMNSPTISHAYENKRYFRDEFSGLIKIPDYEIKYMNELDRAASYKNLTERFEGPFMLQDEDSSGSKGTYAIRNQDDYVEAIKSLKKFSRGRTIVVSKFIHGEVTSIQVCITKYGIFSGGIQRQLVDSKYLCNPDLAGASKWCGGEIGDEYPDIVQHQAREIASIVGSELSSHGYKGIFGVDLIVTPEHEVYAIEINARLTGYSHIISDMQTLQGKIPFMLLHLLELGNFKYEVTDSEALPSVNKFDKPGSLLILNNTLDTDITLDTYIRPGLYRFRQGKITFIRPAYSLESVKGEDTLLILCRHNEGATIESGKRVLKIMKYGRTMYKGELTPKAQQMIQAIKETFNLPN
ncbi:MAG: hypothetical protein JWN82_670 [Candidatus Saccharibacteria bacterium]|nr:hypothetical protein [Candidatus Saccharibacteria bacterium]